MKFIKFYNENTSQYFNVAVLFAFSFLTKIFFLQYFDGPLIFKDELYYRQNALAIFHGLQYVTPHYPPLYSLILAPAFWAKNWYQAMLAINALLSSMLIPAAWFLSCSIGMKRPLLASLLVALLPFHAVYPRFVMSENLFVPLFVLAIALAVRGGRSGKLESILFGITLGAAHLTKYLFLPSVPVLFCAWAVVNFFHQSEDVKTVKPEFSRNFLYAIVPYILLMTLWMCYGYASGYEWQRLLGFGLSGNQKIISSLSRFGFWFMAYSSYVMLMAIPFWALFGSFAVQFLSERFRTQFSRNNVLFLIFLLCLVVGYCFVAANHSYSSKYNVSVPQYILGRYLMQFSPVLMVVYVWVLDVVVLNIRHFSWRKTLVWSILVVCLLGLSWGVLFNDMIVSSSPWFSKITFNAVDVFNFDSIVNLIVFVFSSFLVIFLLRLRIFDVRILVFPLCVALLMNYIISYNIVLENNDGIYARVMFEKIIDSIKSRKKIDILVENCPVSYKDLLYGIKFHNIISQDIDVNFYNNFRYIKFINQNNVFLLASSHFNANAGFIYKSDGNNFSFFQIDSVDNENIKPCILQLHPSSAVAGIAFNQQPSGSSALGLFVSSASSQTVLKFAEHELTLVRGKDGFASTEIPSQYLANPGIIQLRLVDQFTGLESDTVEFKITAF